MKKKKKTIKDIIDFAKKNGKVITVEQAKQLKTTLETSRKTRNALLNGQYYS